MTSKEIAEKYVYGKHEALTDKQEVLDMINDLYLYSKTLLVNYHVFLRGKGNKYIGLSIEDLQNLVCIYLESI